MLTNYLKIAFKVLLRRKFYTGVSLFGIAFTLLILNVCVAFIDHMFAPLAPESRLGRILTIEQAELRGPNDNSRSAAGYALLDRYARDLPGVETFSITTQFQTAALFQGDRKLTLKIRRTDGAYWRVLDFSFLEGSPYTDRDVEEGSFVAVINESLRRRLFDNEPAVGRTLRADDQAFTVVGVVPDVPIIRQLAFSEIWVPLTTAKSTAYKSELIGDMNGLLLVRDRGAFGGVREELATRLAAVQLPDPETHDRLTSGAYTRFEHVAREFFGQHYTDDLPTGRFVLMISLFALLFMMLPALNLINLSLSRILERASEIGVRKAFGASSTTLVGQFLVESIVMTLVGGLLGLGLSGLVLDVLSRSDLIPYAELSLNLRVFGYGLALALLFGVLSGAYPAWRMSRLHPVEALHGRLR
jgi:putative ABC transport system permease protein